MTSLPKAAVNLIRRFSIQILAALGFGILASIVLNSVGLPRLTSHTAIFLSTTAMWGFAALVLVGVYLVNRDNHRLKDCGKELHSINHLYRDALSHLLVADTKNDEITPEQIINFERAILNQICVKIANMFQNLIGRRCVATVKLAITGEESFCFTWARSETSPQRQDTLGDKYMLMTGENFGLDEALKIRANEPSYFFSSDLWKDEINGNYKNQRRNWRKHYRSAIVVPIRRVVEVKTGTIDLIGFLCIDTTSPNRLNDTYCVQYLAAFADQMYNFLSILRGKYILPHEVAEESESELEDE